MTHTRAAMAAALLSLALLGGGFATAQTALTGDPAAPDVGGPETTVGTTLSDTQRMLAPVTINGAGPYQFIVDTGAERTIIAHELALQLGLTPAGRARLLSITNSSYVAMVNLPNISYSAGQTHTLRAFTLSGQNIGAAGVLGIDALHGQRVVLDFEAGQMRVGPAPRQLERLGPNDIIVRARSRYGELVLVDSTAEGQPVDVVIDSGLQVSVGNEALRRLLAARRNQFEPIELLSITGQTLPAQYTRVDNLRIGGVQIIGMPIAFADAYFFNRLRLTRRPALILGMDTLRMFRQVAVDFPNRRAHFVLPEGGVHPPPLTPTPRLTSQ